MATPYVTMICSRCKQETDDFAPHKTLGRQGYCRSCQRAYRESRKAEMQAYDRERKYGVGVEAQVVLYDSQGGRCAACRDDIELADAHLDHNHVTGKVRGFLCGACNRALGHALESPARLRALAEYVESH